MHPRRQRATLRQIHFDDDNDNHLLVLWLARKESIGRGVDKKIKAYDPVVEK